MNELQTTIIEWSATILILVLALFAVGAFVEATVDFIKKLLNKNYPEPTDYISRPEILEKIQSLINKK